MSLDTQETAASNPDAAGAPKHFLVAPSMATLLGVAWLIFGWGRGISAQGDNSFQWHLRTGQWILGHGIPHTDIYSFTAHGTPWVAQSWLAEVLYAALNDVGGQAALRLLGAVAGGILAFFCYRLAVRVSRREIVGAFLILPTMLMGYVGWVERPMFLALLPLLAMIWMVELPESRISRYPLIGIPVVMWLWANIHGSFALGFAYLGLHLLGQWLDGAVPWRGRERRLAQAGIVAFALCFVNPYGTALVTFPVSLLLRGDILTSISEWQSPDFRQPVGYTFALWIVVAFTAFSLAKNRPSRRSVAVALPFLVLGLWAQRNTEIASLVALPMIARLFVAPTAKSESGKPLNAVLLAALVVLEAFVSLRVLAHPSMTPEARYPVQAMKTVQKDGLLGRNLLTQDSWAGYVILNYWPRQRVFIDDRYDMYPRPIINDYLDVLEVRPDWRAVLDRRHINVVVWPTGHPLNQYLTYDRSWREVYADDIATVFERT